jgi:hypothetical protein
MTILVRYASPGMTVAQYDQVSEQVQTSLQWPPDGLILHVCFRSDGDMRVSEVWESREKLEAFQEGLMPLLNEGRDRRGEWRPGVLRRPCSRESGALGHRLAHL